MSEQILWKVRFDMETRLRVQAPRFEAGPLLLPRDAPCLADDVSELRTHFFTRAGVACAVGGVSFSLTPGEVLGLVGESGLGKSVAG